MKSRPEGRKAAELRPLSFQWDIAPNALGSILLRCGNTQVICTASVEESVPPWKRYQNIPGGWVTAEYSMMPASTTPRKQREGAKGKVDGRSMEIQRLIGRSLRAVVDLDLLGERSIWVDCDVLAADGGTRTTAITGAYLAIQLAVERLKKQKLLKVSPLKHAIAATSVGIWEDRAILDLCYIEDRDAAVDMNVVMTDHGEFIELQASGEEATFSPAQLDKLLKLSRRGIKDLFAFQEKAWRARPKR